MTAIMSFPHVPRRPHHRSRYRLPVLIAGLLMLALSAAPVVLHHSSSSHHPIVAAEDAKTSAERMGTSGVAGFSTGACFADPDVPTCGVAASADLLWAVDQGADMYRSDSAQIPRSDSSNSWWDALHYMN